MYRSKELLFVDKKCVSKINSIDNDDLMEFVVVDGHIGSVFLGPISRMIFPSEFKFDGYFILLSSETLSGRYGILHMSRQLRYRGMCKIL